MTKEETKFYERGYAAGRKRKEKDLAELRTEIKKDVVTQFEKEKIYDRYFCAALTGIINSNGWKLGDKQVNNSETYVKLAKIFAEEAIKQNLRY